MEGGSGGDGGRDSTNEGQLDIENYSCNEWREGLVRKTGKEAKAFQRLEETKRKTGIKSERNEKRERQRQEQCKWEGDEENSPTERGGLSTESK